MENSQGFQAGEESMVFNESTQVMGSREDRLRSHTRIYPPAFYLHQAVTTDIDQKVSLEFAL
ncbi:MAG: hypothetical protein CL389_00630 [Acidiferrobacteraceae bacterium]|nr:hypothetical protein [Acidiferrobacteraceae bacterium]